MEIQTIQKYLHTSPRKLRLVADMVRNMTPDNALNILRLTPKAAAVDLTKAIEAVLANSKQQGLDTTKLIFKKVEINESMKMRRFRAGTRGRAKPYKKRMAHIKIVLTDDLSVKGKVQSAKLKTKSENSEKEAVVDNSTIKPKSKKGARTELSK